MNAAVLNHREAETLRRDGCLILERQMRKMPPTWATDPQKIVGPWQSFHGNHPHQRCGHRSCACFNRKKFSIGPVSWTTRCPFGTVGEVRWVKEPWWVDPDGHETHYRADKDDPAVSWLHAITMPRARHRMEVTVRSITIRGAPARWDWAVELALNSKLN